jgi:uncharacterized protein YcfJ
MSASGSPKSTRIVVVGEYGSGQFASSITKEMDLIEDYIFVVPPVEIKRTLSKPAEDPVEVKCKYAKKAEDQDKAVKNMIDGALIVGKSGLELGYGIGTFLYGAVSLAATYVKK